MGCGGGGGGGGGDESKLIFLRNRYSIYSLLIIKVKLGYNN